jgi:hypothetical protein
MFVDIGDIVDHHSEYFFCEMKYMYDVLIVISKNKLEKTRCSYIWIVNDI